MKLLQASIRDGVTPGMVVTPGESTSFVNPYSYLLLRDRPDLMSRIRRWGVDGKSLQVLLSKAWKLPIKRTSFDYTSLAEPVFRRLVETGSSIYVLGSDTVSIERFVKHLSSEYPALKIAGYRNGFFASTAERDAAAEQIVALKPGFVLVGMGAIRQEEFVLSLFDRGFAGATATCGGFIHQTASHGKSYYPAWVDKYNLRFAYRMYDERALMRRYFIDYPRALACILQDLRIENGLQDR